MPLLWIFATSFKTPPDSIAYPPKIVFQPSLEGYCNLFTTRTRQTPEYINSLGPATGFCDEITRKRNMVIAGPSNFLPRFVNSLIIAFGSTFCAVFLGTLVGLWLLALQGAAGRRPAVLHPVDALHAADRGRDPDLPDVPPARPVRHRARHDPALHGGQRVAGGVAAEGLHRRNPARIRGSGDDRRLYAAAGVLASVVLPQATTGIAATAIFCLIFAWNEYAFAALLTSGTAQTAPPFIPTIIGEGGQDWPAVAAGTTIFLVPILVFTILLRKQLLRGITFGAVRK